MRKIRDDEEHGEGNSERWLLTYSDMITLLLALFTVLYAISSVDAKKFQMVADGLGEALHGPGTNVSGGAGNGNGNGLGTVGSSTGACTTGTTAPTDTHEEIIIPPASDELQKLQQELIKYIDQNKLEDDIQLENTNKYVKIHLKNTLMFYPDSSKMIEKSIPILKEIGKVLAKIYPDIDHITISGNTADVGQTDHQSKTNAWRLSTERSVTVLSYLTKFGLQEDKLSIEGNSHYDPIANNSTEQGMAKNRRVDITIYKDWDSPADSAIKHTASQPQQAVTTMQTTLTAKQTTSKAS